MTTMRKVALSAVVLCMTTALAIVAIALVGIQKDAPAETVSIVQSSTAPKLGETVTVTAIIRLPWHRRITAPPRLALPDGLQLTAIPMPSPIKIGLGHLDWQAQINLQAVTFGPFSGQSATVPLSARRDGSDADAAIDILALAPTPRFSVQDPHNLRQMGKLTPPVVEDETPPRWPWIVTACIALLMLVIVLLKPAADKSTMQPSTPPSPPCLIANQALDQLEKELPMQPDRFFVRLIDVLRRYLESAFHLRATEQTTAEFLQSMQATPDLLTDDHSILLEEVIRAADIVKFARTGASDDQMRDALTKGRRFIVESAEALRSPLPNGAVADE